MPYIIIQFYRHKKDLPKTLNFRGKYIATNVPDEYSKKDRLLISRELEKSMRKTIESWSYKKKQ